MIYGSCDILGLRWSTDRGTFYLEKGAHGVEGAELAVVGRVVEEGVALGLGARARNIVHHRHHLYEVMLQKSIPPQIRQLISEMKNKLTDLCGN